MEKIFKKSLALMVSAALCLTAFVGCLTVNAEATATPTYTITAQNGKAGDTVTVNVDGTNLTSVCGQQVFINIPAALTIASVKDNAGNPYINVANVTEGEAFDYSVVTTETTKQVRFADIINFPATGSDGAIATAEFHIVFELTIPAAAAVSDTYEIAFDTATMFADIDENAIGITVTPATITVQAAVAEPVLDESITFMTRSTSIQDTLGIGYVVLKSAVADYSRFEIVVTATKYDSSRNTYVADPVVLDLTEKAAFYVGVYSGIAMYELDQNVSAYIKCYDANDNFVAYSATVNDTPVGLLTDLYNTSIKNNKVETLRVITDMINLGAAAQTYFGSYAPGSELANATLMNDGWDQTYATEGDLTGLNIVDNLNWAVNSPLTSADIKVTPSLNFAATPTITYLFQDLNGSLDFADFTFTVSYDAQYPTAFAGTHSATATGDQFVSVSSYKLYTFSGMTLADSNCPITATLYYQGEEVLTYEYTMDAGINSKLTGAANTVALSSALGKFEASARAYFAAN